MNKKVRYDSKKLKRQDHAYPFPVNSPVTKTEIKVEGKLTDNYWIFQKPSTDKDQAEKR